MDIVKCKTSSKKQYTLSSIAAEMREFADADSQVVGRDVLRRRIQDFSRLIEQLASDCNQLGNTAKMHEALKQIVDITTPCEGVTSTELQVNDIAYDAISSQPRNCDVGTAEEQYKRFLKFCHGANCSKCPVHDAINCKFAWAQMSYEEAKGEE